MVRFTLEGINVSAELLEQLRRFGERLGTDVAVSFDGTALVLELEPLEQLNAMHVVAALAQLGGGFGLGMLAAVGTMGGGRN